MFEYLQIQGQKLKHRVVAIARDGACLFRSLSFILYGSKNNTRKVRELIIQHVVTNWDRFQITSHDEFGNNHDTAESYQLDMSHESTYGSHCELIAAGEIFRFCFEVYTDGKLYHQYGDINNPVGRLRFSGSFGAGHFDIYIEVRQTHQVAVVAEEPEEVNNEPQNTFIMVSSDMHEPAF